MSNKEVLTPAGIELRQQLTREVKMHAAMARAKVLHPVRVYHAVECGKALTRLKDLIVNGGWNQWLVEQCGLNRMAANRYRRLARHPDRLTPYMTIREAYIAAGVIARKP
jgi:hypothetical protein